MNRHDVAFDPRCFQADSASCCKSPSIHALVVISMTLERKSGQSNLSRNNVALTLLATHSSKTRKAPMAFRQSGQLHSLESLLQMGLRLPKKKKKK